MEHIQNLCETDHYFVRSWYGSEASQFIVVSFTGIDAPERYDGSFFGAALARQLDLPWVGVVARQNGWYREGDYTAIFQLIRAWIAKRRMALSTPGSVRVIGYGISMGAYAAIKYSRVLGLDNVLALAPQWSLDKEEAPYFSQFKHFFQPFMKRMGISQEDVSGRIYALYDPYELPDLEEIENLRYHTEVEPVAACYASHMVLSCLKGSKPFRAMLDNLDNPAAVCQIVAETRRYNIENIIRVIERAFRHRPSLGAKALTCRRTMLAVNQCSRDQSNRLWRIAADLMRFGYTRDADAFFAMATGNHPPAVALPRLMNWRGELLCYNHASGEFSQTHRHLCQDGTMVTLLGNELVAVTPAGLVPVPGRVKAIRGRCSIEINGHYLSSRENGRIELLSTLDDWEEFILLPVRQWPCMR
ncbi:alpha/beta fold hydrolase [Gluconobacter morbifer]|uniref:Alpha/beta hydrolase n=1 Tax=Gluconobacter morbifer G707 TaxID=1088869 RepID=G6XL75_9PROT|nr:hypothetical protein [Gluconobacter morbifer]EHH67503.1 hypothetical protein GMO_24980 [Gluconobacter morbifer G707]